MWMVYAFLSAIAAAFVALFGKLGLSSVDPTLATTLRAIFMAAFMVLASLASGKFRGFSPADLGGRGWMWIALSAVAGAVSWLFYFVALKGGDATRVAAIDRLSIVFIVLLASLFLGESLTWRSGLGALLIALGAAILVWR